MSKSDSTSTLMESFSRLEKTKMLDFDPDLFFDIFGRKIEDVACDPLFCECFENVTSCSYDNLVQQPLNLNEKHAKLRRVTEDLTYVNYKTFIQAAECSREVLEKFNTVCDCTDTLLGSFPQLKADCRMFVTEGHQLVNRIKQDNAILTGESESTIRSILNIPRALSACVYAARYEDALELIQSVSELEKHFGQLLIFKDVMNDVQLQRSAILDYCVDQMESDLTVAAALKVVSFLRRLGVYSEAELRFKFLHARDVWFQSQLDAQKSADSLLSVCHMIEVHRLHLFDVVTQYRAVFLDEEPAFVPTAMLTGKHADVVLSAILGSWIVHKIGRFLKALSASLNDDRVLENLDSVLSQCMYFGLSMGRIGADFRLLMVPVFENAILQAIGDHVESASARLREKMKFSKTFISNSDYAMDSPVSKDASSQDTEAMVSTTGSAVSVPRPPSTLLRYTQLAVYCNEVLQALNKVRNCIPLKLACQVTSIMQQAFESVLTCLKEKLENDRDYHAEDARSDLVNFGKVFVNDFASFVNCCLEVLFPSEALASALGVPFSQFSQMGSMGRIDVKRLTELMSPSISQQLRVPVN